MARTPAVIQGPPKQNGRAAVVVREGRAPRNKRFIADNVLGAIGAVLLLLAIALFGILPDEELPPSPWQVTYTDTLVEFTDVENYDFQDQQSHRFSFPMESEAVYAVQFTVEFRDDVASSLPDTFELQIFGPDSEPVTEEVRVTSITPESDGNILLPTYTAETTQYTITGEVAPLPISGPQLPSSDDEDLPNAQARFEDQLITRPAGNWVLDVRLSNVGQCPSGAEADNPGHILACETETQQERDNGNSLQVVKVSFTTYEVLVAV